MTDATRLFTLEEARREIAAATCRLRDHDWVIVQQAGVGPTHLICERCGDTRNVEPPRGKTP